MEKKVIVENSNPLPEWLHKYYNPLVGNRMLELGNKQTLGTTYKEYFENMGIEHISIDKSGFRGSLPLDLTVPIEMEPFDMVTNIGTTEHVSSQAPAWENIHNLCKVGGVVISSTPVEGDWWWHGQFYPKESFFEEFTKNGYKIELMNIDEPHPKRVLNVRMLKVSHEPFTMPNKETIFNNTMRPR